MNPNFYPRFLVQLSLCLLLSGCSFFGRMTPFQRAVWHGDLVKTQVFLAQGADLYTTDTTTGLSPIELAIDSGRMDMVKLLIESVADVNSFEAKGVSPLSRAVLRENVEMCNFLIGKGVHVNTNILEDVSGWMIPLVQAAKVGNLVLIELLIQSGANVNANEGKGVTPLHAAVGKGYSWTPKSEIETTKLLIKYGANVNMRSHDGSTPLHEVVTFGRKEVADLLIRSGANVNAKNDNGWTPLHCAVSQYNTEMVELLIANHADVNAKMCFGATPLHFAVTPSEDDNMSQCIEVVRLLLDHGALIDAEVPGPGIYDGTPLCWAAREGHVEIARVLIERGANVNYRSKTMEDSPFYWAKFRDKNKKLIKLLQAHGAVE